MVIVGPLLKLAGFYRAVRCAGDARSLLGAQFCLFSGLLRIGSFEKITENSFELLMTVSFYTFTMIENPILYMQRSRVSIISSRSHLA